MLSNIFVLIIYGYALSINLYYNIYNYTIIYIIYMGKGRSNVVSPVISIFPQVN